MIDDNAYGKFVDYVTSYPSKSTQGLINSILEIENSGGQPARLLTGSIGLASESGELAELVKKIVFQGKPYDTDNVYHMKREISDCMWYIMQLCMALDVSLEEIVNMNVEKLKARYPDGFEVYRSENRSKNDI